MRYLLPFFLAFLLLPALSAAANSDAIRFYEEAPKVATYSAGYYITGREAYWIDNDNILYRTFDKTDNSFQLIKFNISSQQSEKLYDVGNGHYCYDPLSKQILINVENQGLEKQKSIWDSEYLSGKIGAPLESTKIYNPQFAKYTENRFDCSIIEKDHYTPPVNPPLVMPLRKGDGTLRIEKDQADFRFYTLKTDDGSEHKIPMKGNWLPYLNVSYNGNEGWYWIMQGNTNPVRRLVFFKIKINKNDVTMEPVEIPPIQGSELGTGIGALPIQNGWALVDELLISHNQELGHQNDRNIYNYNFYIKKNDDAEVKLITQRNDDHIELLDVSPDGCKVAIKEYLPEHRWHTVEGILGVWNVCQ